MSKALTLALISSLGMCVGVTGLCFFHQRQLQQRINRLETTMEVTIPIHLVVDGKAYDFNLIRRDDALIGELPEPCKVKYSIKSFSNGKRSKQFLVDKRLSQFGDGPDTWVEHGKAVSLGGNGTGGSWYRYANTPSGVVELVAAATVSVGGDITAGWPPVYS